MGVAISGALVYNGIKVVKSAIKVVRSGEIQPPFQQRVENAAFPPLSEYYEKEVTTMAQTLMGTYEHTIDAKGRMAFPTRLREQLGDAFVITIDPSGCLFVYSNEEWEAFTEKIKTLTGTAAKAAVRKLYANAVSAEADKQGRVLIPQKLREYAGLVHDVTVIGNLNHAEIWDSLRFAEQEARFSDEELAAALDSIAF